MCTVSIVPHRDGLRVMSNRDERRDRAVALAPQLISLGSMTAVLPIDPVGGGSWIGANDAGLVAAVLNRHQGGSCDEARTSASRGELVPMALGFGSIDAALSALQAIDPGRYRPFRLVLVQKHEMAFVVGDTRRFTFSTATLREPSMFTASSLGDRFVDTPRRRLFEWLMMDHGAQLDGQSVFHRHQWTGKGDISVVMERGDAATVSRTTVDVGAVVVALEYESLAPPQPVQRVELSGC